MTKLLDLKDDWKNLESPYGSIFLSIPTVLDPSLAPEGRHILHVFTTSSIEDWKVDLLIFIPRSTAHCQKSIFSLHNYEMASFCQGLSPTAYEAKKEVVSDRIISRLEKKLFPGLKAAVVFKEVYLVL